MKNLLSGRHGRGIFGAALLVFGVSGCGSDGSSGGGGAGGSSGAQGGHPSTDSTCGASHCDVGQHCFNGVCIDGCLTDANCAATQRCEDVNADTKIGTCKAAPVAPAKDCDAFCRKAQACQDPEAALCMQKCEGYSAECVACVNDSNCGDGCDGVCTG